MAAPHHHALGSSDQADALPARASAVRLPLPVAGRWGPPPRMCGHGLRGALAHSATHLRRGVHEGAVRH
eukprot:5241738-Alexandrium_andersonii.AAC.2